MNRRTKLKRQFDEWNSEVYGAIQDQINARLDNVDASQINARRRREFQKFLDTTNAKGAIFRDIIIESEYDPLEPNRNCIKVDTNGLRDPVKRVLDKHFEETSTLDAGGGNDDDRSGTTRRRPRRPRALTREVLDITEWGAGKIESTPHGYFAKLMDEKKGSSGGGGPGEEKKKSKTYDSQIPFDHYNVATGPLATVGEFPVGKRTTQVPTTIKIA